MRAGRGAKRGATAVATPNPACHSNALEFWGSHPDVSTLGVGTGRAGTFSLAARDGNNAMSHDDSSMSARRHEPGERECVREDGRDGRALGSK